VDVEFVDGVDVSYWRRLSQGRIQGVRVQTPEIIAKILLVYLSVNLFTVALISNIEQR